MSRSLLRLAGEERGGQVLRMRALLTAVFVLSLMTLSPAPAQAAQVLRCVGSAEWTFSTGITIVPTSGTAVVDWTLTCVILHEPSGAVTIENRVGTTPFGYLGNCASMSLTLFGVPAGSVAGEAIAEVTTTVAATTPNSLTFVFERHTPCSGQVVLPSVWEVTEFQPFFS